MNDLEAYFHANTTGRQIWKWHHYFEIYERHLGSYRNKSPVLLEIGVYQGGSLRMWKDYMGVGAQIHGLDLNPACRVFEEEGVRIHIGSQEDRAFLMSVGSAAGPFDVILDDGGHTMRQQITSLESLLAFVRDGGVYVCEDTGTSYRPNFGGGYRYHGSFIEYVKRIIDDLNAWHAPKHSSLLVGERTRSIFGVHFYNGMVVIEKRKIEPPVEVKSGLRVFGRDRDECLRPVIGVRERLRASVLGRLGPILGRWNL